MIMDLLFLAAGLVLLFIGGEGLVRGSVALATRFGLSTLLVSLVIVGFGTSTPELLISVKVALAGSSDIALGNVVGSNICNILLILGLAAAISSVDCSQGAVRRDALAVVAASVLIAALSFLDEISRMTGVILLSSLLAYLYYSYALERRAQRKEAAKNQALRAHIEEEKELPVKPSPLWLDLAFTLGGLAVLVWGADLLLTGATSLARGAGISEAVIGLTLVAVGTSLPELATAVIAAYRKHADVVIGNILGSNLFNILGILGITAIIIPVPVTPQIAGFDIWVMLAVAVLLLALIRVNGNLARYSAAAFLISYGLYVGYLYTGAA